jgi:hypothetical protein
MVMMYHYHWIDHLIILRHVMDPSQPMGPWGSDLERGIREAISLKSFGAWHQERRADLLLTLDVS